MHTENRVAENINQAIIENGKLKKDIASELGFTKTQFSDLLNGRKIIRSEYLPILAKAIGCEINRFFDGV